MNFLRRFFGRTHDQNDLLSIDLWEIAEERKGHISLQAVINEYDRLTSEKHGLTSAGSEHFASPTLVPTG
jgi:hypothetical protein